MKATYTVDIKRLSIKDGATLQRAIKDGIDIMAFLPILNKLVIMDDGSNAEDLPYEHLEEILIAIGERISKPNPT
jgi:hypothetical protein